MDYRLVPPAEPLRDGFGKKVKSRNRPGGSAGQYELNGLNALSSITKEGASMGGKAGQGWNGLPLSMSGKDYDRFFGDENDDSSDDGIPASRKNGPAPAALLGGPSAAGMLGNNTSGGPEGALGADLGAGRDAMGRMKGATDLADVDPLGVNMQIDFGSVGGLDHHVQQLKEMVSLPLLYPEVFQRFKVTPPRGVLFHGPPGTGKTLVARALAASCSSSGQQISFFMRKGADCLSKWVGEAERQLRLLFEEAKNSQPSIIFFDEIDGLAPVRSSKQDQIHASIVSTLLALMDGMDGRGQVVIIGATNRPDSVDPALRRPGRFDREFYFPLPSLEARRSIINIHTKNWEPPLEDSFKDKLAEVTKGYGGADLRALCTEAALNAIQRRYPQIYQTSDRLELKPETIQVEAKDFMMSVNKVVPSSARSSGSAAAALPQHLKPLLEESLLSSVRVLERVLPRSPDRNPLEEALWEDDLTDNDNGFGRELTLQVFEQLRVFRPRMIIHGKQGMGQSYIGAALLHHLEGYHVQSLDAASLLGDSGSTMESAVVQMFNEAKRHKPSVLFIPGLLQWGYNTTESVRSTLKSLLDGLAPSEPILLVAVSDGPLEKLPRDVRAWFGFTRENRIELRAPSTPQRQAYLKELLHFAIKPPTEYPDALPRRRRVLEDLPKAPPRAPRVPTAAELRQQAAEDARLLEHLKFRLGPVLAELKKKFPRFKRDVWQEYNLYDLTSQFDWQKVKNKVIVTLLYEPDSQLLQRLQASSPGAEDGAWKKNTSQDHSDDAQPTSVDVSAAAVPDGSAGETGTEMQQVQLQSEDSTALTGLAAAMSGDFSAANPPPVNNLPSSSLKGFRRDESGFFVRDLQIWTVNLEKMQKRLYYNGYLTVNDFIEDLGKIVSNAEEAQEVDEDRLTRAHQLRNLAVILIDQYIDADFRASCERMAQRMLRREEEAREEAEKQRKAQLEKEQRPRGERHSSRLHGEEPQVSTLEELGAIERKRSRGHDDTMQVDSGGLVEGEEERKKARLQEEFVSDSASVLPGNQPYDVSTAGVEHSNLSASSIPARLGVTDTQENRSIFSPIVSSPTAENVSENQTSHPPFSYSDQEYEKLQYDLLHTTQNFNVEQLEQLRATLFSVIWKHRGDWDKRDLFSRLAELVRVVKEEVDEYNHQEQVEDEKESLLG